MTFRDVWSQRRAEILVWATFIILGVIATSLYFSKAQMLPRHEADKATAQTDTLTHDMDTVKAKLDTATAKLDTIENQQGAMRDWIEKRDPEFKVDSLLGDTL